ncbi:MAG: hypothetical protein CMQ13_08280 [Gammaproteobacteria bacterium]|nr:hypothetical protein [Gammaproteobacteria bacterium]|tara:strand:+ start:3817 stop:4308 length:492 start_codon:yes stop_codon:yes gene_type:complete
MAGPELVVLAAITTALTAKAQLDAGKAEQYALNAQAKQAELQGRTEALKYKQQGNQILNNLEKVLAANAARASAGNMDPMASGTTTDLIAGLNIREGVSDFQISRSNADIAKKMSKYQAGMLRTAGSNVMKAARTQAFITIGKGATSANEIYPLENFKGGATD